MGQAAQPLNEGVRLRTLDPLADSRWDPFVRAHPRSTIYHLAAWSRILSDAYRFSPLCLGLEDGDGRLLGVLPGAYKAGPISGRRITSLPVVGQGGPLASTHELEATLLAAACRQADSLGSVLRLRSRVGDYGQSVPAVAAAPHAPSWVVPLPADADDLRRGWKRQGHLLRNLRKAEAAGLTVRVGRSEHDLRAFYAVYLRTMKRHRAVPRSYRLLALSRRTLGPCGAFELLLVEKDDRVLAGCVAFSFRQAGEVLFVAVDDRYHDVRPSYALHWHAIRRAVARGVQQLNLGTTTRGSSQAAFKAQWGAEPLDEFEYVYPAGPATGPRAQRALGLWRGRIAAAAWARAPIPVTRLAGAVLHRYL